MTQFKWRHQWADDEREQDERDAAAIYTPPEEGMTQQQFAEDANLNNIIRRFGINDLSQLPQAIDPSHYGDFSDAPSFRQALDNLAAAQEHFDVLPADIRRRFNHDPVELYEFVRNGENYDESVKMGLLKDIRPQATPTVEVVTTQPLPPNPRATP